MFDKINSYGLNDFEFLEVYHSRQLDPSSKLNQIMKEYSLRDPSITWDSVSTKVQQISVCLGSYCVEELFAYLLDFKAYTTTEALEIIGILPKSSSFELAPYRGNWKEKDSTKCYKNIIKNR